MLELIPLIERAKSASVDFLNGLGGELLLGLNVEGGAIDPCQEVWMSGVFWVVEWDLEGVCQ